MAGREKRKWKGQPRASGLMVEGGGTTDDTFVGL